MTTTQAGKKHQPRTDKGTATRRRLLEAAEQVFAERGYHDASIVKITEAAGVAGGTFYIYFKSKQDIFDELVIDLNQRVRHAMAEASSQGTSRSDAERRGFEAFFRFTGEHPALYRIIRQAEFVSPHTLRLHYQRIVEGYIDGLERAQAAGEVAPLDPEVAAWALMGAGELIGMRYVLWDDQRRIPQHVFDELMAFVRRGLGASDEQRGS
jgi:AcrR family transcriptional regulator